MSAVILPVPELHPRSLGSRNTVLAGPDSGSGPARYAPWIHDTCPACGWDGDAAVIRDIQGGLIGWECPDPDCASFVTTRDLEDA